MEVQVMRGLLNVCGGVNCQDVYNLRFQTYEWPVHLYKVSAACSRCPPVVLVSVRWTAVALKMVAAKQSRISDRRNKGVKQQSL